MNLKKLIPELVSGLKDAGFDANPKEIQSTSIPQIKSGADLFIVSPEGSGKSTAIVIGVIQQLKEAFEDVPRAIIMAATKEKAFELEAQFELLGKHTNLRTFTVFDKGILQYQKDTIYEGLDVLIGTPRRLNELLKATGIPLSQIKMFVVDDVASFTLDKYTMIYRIADNIEKSQMILVANAWDKKFEKLTDRIMKSPRIIEVG
ncbi:DEAD/DEAH box helicase [Flammeovirgaceae bacterium SG7u.111]|nr:DEAD/DEAH box helicase [Flammeovirgaceae bacterium SG7u.132]WPO36964.1 DEAD/DEAH box helicase [Flammeovirgaceae bacterium SG7u.111]